MTRPSFWLSPHRVAVGLPLIGALMLIAVPVAAAGDPQSVVDSASQSLHNAQSQASSADHALTAARADLASATARLAALDRAIVTPHATIVRRNGEQTPIDH